MEKQQHHRVRAVFYVEKTTLEKILHRLRHIIEYPVRKIGLLMHRLRPEFWLCRGNEANSGYPLSILYAGCDQQYRNYIVTLAFGGAVEQKFMGRRWIWGIPGLAGTMTSQCDFLVVETDRCIDLIHNPFVFYPEKRVRHAAFFTEAGLDLSNGEIEQMLESYRNFRGIDMWHLFPFGKREKNEEKVTFPTYMNMTITISSADNFLS